MARWIRPHLGPGAVALNSPPGNVNYHVRGETFIADGRWHTLRAMRDANEGMLRVFVDGRLDGEAPDTTFGDFATPSPITIGAYLWGSHSRFAQADIADVQIESLGRLVGPGGR